jgi:hypothetical protein
MTNLNTDFQEFNKKLTLSSSRKEKLKASKDALKNKIISYFKDNTALSVPEFYIQGSYKMGTMILKKDNTYDVDLGVYFEDNKGITGELLQKKVLNAVKEHTDGGARHKRNCIQVVYSGEYNIDLPVFYKDAWGNYILASKDNDKPDDTRQMVDWFNEKKDANGQLVRLIKYMKAWANTRSHKMPSGIMLTIWLTNHFYSNERDDIALLETLRQTYYCIQLHGRKCINPVNQKEDLASQLTTTQKINFETEMGTLIRTIENATNSSDRTKAYQALKPFFGNRF